MTKCKHCNAESNPYMSGFCPRCYNNQFETEVRLTLSKDDCDFISELLYKESMKSKEPYKTNIITLAKKLNGRLNE